MALRPCALHWPLPLTPSLAQHAGAPIPPAVTPCRTAERPRRQRSPATPFGEDTALTAKTIIYIKGSGTWDKAFETITGSFKKIKAYLDKEGLKPDGLPMTIFTATDDTGFEYPGRHADRRSAEEPAAWRNRDRPVAGRPRAQIRPSRFV